MVESNILKADDDLIDQVKFDEKGLIPAVAQHHRTGEILMLAYMNRESLDRTLETGNATYWSRSRRKLWMKGETSGHIQKVQQILLDCDADSLVLLVEQVGPACHTGEESCFHKTVAKREPRKRTTCGCCSECSP